MKVWVLEEGQWVDQRPTGVYSSLEIAIERNPVPADAVPYLSGEEVGWTFEREYGYWQNGARGKHHMVLTELEVGPDAPKQLVEARDRVAG